VRFEAIRRLEAHIIVPVTEPFDDAPAATPADADD
jgi:hypothetical protein